MIRSAECCQYAIEGGRLARLTKSPCEKDALFGIARAWETFAKHIEHYEKARVEATKLDPVEC